jgi:hypothetical protein
VNANARPASSTMSAMVKPGRADLVMMMAMLVWWI